MTGLLIIAGAGMGSDIGLAMFEEFGEDPVTSATGCRLSQHATEGYNYYDISEAMLTNGPAFERFWKRTSREYVGATTHCGYHVLDKWASRLAADAG